jgi:hypothetical protein
LLFFQCERKLPLDEDRRGLRYVSRPQTGRPASTLETGRLRSTASPQR